MENMDIPKKNMKINFENRKRTAKHNNSKLKDDRLIY